MALIHDLVATEFTSEFTDTPPIRRTLFFQNGQLAHGSVSSMSTRVVDEVVAITIKGGGRSRERNDITLLERTWPIASAIRAERKRKTVVRQRVHPAIRYFARYNANILRRVHQATWHYITYE